MLLSWPDPFYLTTTFENKIDFLLCYLHSRHPIHGNPLCIAKELYLHLIDHLSVSFS